MKVFIIGGLSAQTSEAAEHQEQQALLSASMERIGKDLVLHGHDLLVCSAFEGSADLAAVRGAATALEQNGGPAVEFHYPDSAGVREQIQTLCETLGLRRVERFAYFPLPAAEAPRQLSTHAWLLAQLAAMQRSHSILALGGKPSGSASLLLALAESQHKQILPLTFLGGAAADSFARLRYELQDRLGSGVSARLDATSAGDAVLLLEQLTAERVTQATSGAGITFFISYPRTRPQEADFVEMVLRRRNFEVYRDERDFGAGRPLPGEIRENIHRATVFIAIWCREYACSPWCFDELQLALDRSEAGATTLWLLCVDDTRIVPPGARNLVSYPSKDREELERHLLILLDRVQTAW
jgi:hypothetical protein